MKNILILLITCIISLFACSSDKKVDIAQDTKLLDENVQVKSNAQIPYRQGYNPNLWDDKIKPIEFTPEQLKVAEGIKAYPPIIALRNAFNDYLSGKRESKYFLQSALGDSLTIIDRIGLDAFSHYYYKDKFAALVFNDLENDTEDDGDIVEVFIMSSTNPDRVFVAHLLNQGDAENPHYVLKLFFQSHHTNEEINTMRNQLRVILKQDKYLF
ncbi:MAG TPA: hypothetical protein PLE30_03895 [Candidatus Kapabacteria bacterium]|nr:hypothetical protein [Candidatus Kapabacteria bacterium]